MDQESYQSKSVIRGFILLIYMAGMGLSVVGFTNANALADARHSVVEIKVICVVCFLVSTFIYFYVMNGIQLDHENYQRVKSAAPSKPIVPVNKQPDNGAAKERLIRSSPVPARKNGDLLPTERLYIEQQRREREERHQRARTARFEEQRAERERISAELKARKAERHGQSQENLAAELAAFDEAMRKNWEENMPRRERRDA